MILENAIIDIYLKENSLVSSCKYNNYALKYFIIIYYLHFNKYQIISNPFKQLPTFKHPHITP